MPTAATGCGWCCGAASDSARRARPVDCPSDLPIAADRPFLRALPQVMRALILLPERDGGQLAVLRAAVTHLRRAACIGHSALRVGHVDILAVPG